MIRYKVAVKLHKDFISVDGGKITVGVTSRPEKGKANEEVIRKIAGYFRVPRSAVKIISGRASRKKLVEIAPLEVLRPKNSYQGKPDF